MARTQKIIRPRYCASVSFWNVLIGGAAGFLIGGGIGAALPAISGFLSSSFTLALLAFADGTAVTISGAQIAGVGALIGGIMFFASNNRPGNNKAQNKQFKDAMRELNVTNKDQMRRVHDKIKGKNMGYNELIEFIKEILKIK